MGQSITIHHISTQFHKFTCPLPINRVIITYSPKGPATAQAIANSSRQILLDNGLPGQIGDLAPNFITGSNLFRVDFNLMKRLKIADAKDRDIQ